MYCDLSNKGELRQGDIVRGLYYPNMACDTLGVAGVPLADADPYTEHLALSASLAKSLNKFWLSAQVQVHRCYAMILSPCCDLEPRSKGKLDVPAIVATPLVDVPYRIRTSPEKLASDMRMPALQASLYTKHSHAPWS